LPPSGQGRPGPELRSDARRNQQRILRAAARLLAADPTSTIQRIADEAQVARPTVYRRYPTREALIEAITAEALAEFGVALDHAASRGGSAAEAIEQLIRSLTRISGDYPILLSGLDSVHQPGDDPHRAERADTAALVGRFDAQIARGQRDRSIRADLAPEVLRHSLFGALYMSLRLRQRQPAGTRFGPDEIGEQVASLIMEGMRPRARAESGRADQPR
jgi:AcrR family transcriptional regulator